MSTLISVFKPDLEILKSGLFFFGSDPELSTSFLYTGFGEATFSGDGFEATLGFRVGLPFDFVLNSIKESSSGFLIFESNPVRLILGSTDNSQSKGEMKD